MPTNTMKNTRFSVRQTERFVRFLVESSPTSKLTTNRSSSEANPTPFNSCMGMFGWR